MPPTRRTPATPAAPAAPGRDAVPDVPSDAALVALVVLGDEAAGHRLRARHEPSVGPYADHLAAPDGPELLGDAWARLLEGVRLGAGLDVPVRVAWVSLVAQHATGSRVARPWVGGDTTWAAFLSLPPAWQVVLWHAEVEGDPPEVLAALAGADQSSVERWTRVARGALRREVVRRHLSTLSDAACLRLATGLLGDLDAAASPVELGHLHTHGLGCASCGELSADVLGVERDLGRVLARRVLGDDTGWYVGEVDAVPVPVPLPAPVPALASAPAPAPAPAPVLEPVAAPTPPAAHPEPRPTPLPTPRPAARTTSRPAPVRRRGGSLLVGVAAAAVVAGILVGLRDDAPLDADLEAGREAGGRQGRTAQVADGGPAASARTAPARPAGTAPAVSSAVPASEPVDAPAAARAAVPADRSAPDRSSSPSAPTGPSSPSTSPPAGGTGTSAGTGGGVSTGTDPVPQPPTGTPELPLRLSVDRDSGSATVELDPPLLGGSLSLSTPPLGALGGLGAGDR